MRDLRVGLTPGIRSATSIGHKQARVDESIHYTTLARCQISQHDTFACDVLTLDGDEPEERLEDEVDSVLRAQRGHRLVRMPCESTGDTAETAVQLGRDRLAGAGGEVQLLEEIGQQG